MSSALGWGPFAFIVKFSRLIFSCVCVRVFVFFNKGETKRGYNMILTSNIYICVCDWLVVWTFFIFPYIENVIIPTDFHSIIFQRGRRTNQQPDEMGVSENGGSTTFFCVAVGGGLFS